MEQIPSLQSIMNSMVGRLDDILPDQLQNLSEDKDWPFIHLYLKIDPVLAQLYKQYCDARAKLSRLCAERGKDDPMSEIAADMKDSAHAAVATRMLELQEDTVVQGQISAALPRVQRVETPKQLEPEDAFDRMIAFMIWAKLVIKSVKPHQDVRRHFRLAA